MYKLTVDCGTAVDVVELKDEESVREHMIGLEEYDEGVTETLLEHGVAHCGIDTITLEKVFETYEIAIGTLLEGKRDGDFRVVKGLYVVKDGTTVVQNYEFSCDECGNIEINYETGVGSSLKNIYINYDLVGEDFKLFIKE